jgi:hypothetical protein
MAFGDHTVAAGDPANASTIVGIYLDCVSGLAIAFIPAVVAVILSMSSLLLLVSGVTAAACVSAVACIPAVAVIAGVPLVPVVLSVARLPAITGIPGCWLNAVVFIPAGSRVPAVLAVWTCRAYLSLFTISRVDVQAGCESLSTVSSVDVQGVYPFSPQAVWTCRVHLSRSR